MRRSSEYTTAPCRHYSAMWRVVTSRPALVLLALTGVLNVVILLTTNGGDATREYDPAAVRRLAARRRDRRCERSVPICLGTLVKPGQRQYGARIAIHSPWDSVFFVLTYSIGLPPPPPPPPPPPKSHISSPPPP